MALTLDVLVVRAAEFLEDTAYGRWTAALITKYINDAQRDFARGTRICRKYSALMATSSTTPLGGFYTLPTDLLEIQPGGLWVTFGTQSLQLPSVTVGGLGDNWDALSSDPPIAYIDLLEFGLTELRLYPYPSDGYIWVTPAAYTAGTNVTKGGNVYTCITAGTSGATGPTGTTANQTDGTAHWSYVRPALSPKLYYAYLPADLSGTQSSPIPEQYHMALVYYAVAMCLMGFKQGSDPARATAYMGMYERDLADATARVGRRFGSTGAVVPFGNV